ncbi:pyridoxamine 5'-phosphate oxidase family protein [Pantoea sp. GD03673]|uniref:pyridoxamine 5'-phosphate oxidase family protein n=1 Tax=Pantoea sp. GD03673 TaxID=2975364 RepID=UPI00244A1B82|nr:pyridoxamine 5'-phosphate oxidase family protein [Pantoea sp. GD03673]MDH2069285.1 pyridoxamine 5'-phosphate oxidase family protein [Pantoea sp. GD03673]
MDLKTFEADAWRALAEAAADPQAGFRYLTLATVDAARHPQARTVVLRKCDDARRILTFHTDVRSPKWLEMAANPQVTVLGYCHQRRLQLRLAGQVECYAAGSAIARDAWRALPRHTRQTYNGGPPGEALATLNETPDATAVEAGESRFGVVMVQVSVLDAYQLQRNENQRALFRYPASGEQQESGWIHP